jgi:pimeloyl-ACP methyl ester carboxylesterase
MIVVRAAVVLLLLAKFAVAQGHVSFPTQDGGVVSADEYGRGARGVVLAHGGKFNKESWAKQAQELEKTGFHVLAIDFRGYGQSRAGKPSKSPYDDLQYDVLAAVRYLHRHGAKSVAIVGASMGGGAAAQASIEAAPGEIGRMVLLAPSSVDHPEEMKGRKLFITSRDDAHGDGELRLPEIQAMFDKAPDPKQWIVLAGSAHAQAIFYTAQGQRLMQEILRFLTAP